MGPSWSTMVCFFALDDVEQLYLLEKNSVRSPAGSEMGSIFIAPYFESVLCSDEIGNLHASEPCVLIPEVQITMA